MSKEAIWDYWAKHYEQLWVQKYSLGPTRREILLFLERQIKAGETYRILDVGCATGQLLREIKEKFPDHKLELFGIDYSQAMIQRAREQDNSINYKQRDVRDIRSLTDHFDIILCTHSFPYYKDQADAINGFSHCLNSGGYLLLAQASENNLYDRLALSLVKLTTGTANYPSIQAILGMTERLFKCESITRIKERFFMPSIYFFSLTKRNIEQGEGHE